ncbi:MAG: AraC family transcriptional regulator [Merismopedia sp. SIO2A8]|nr:AraC family transcriptional regulator [Symploca sp. SIO2B6]NET53008.1 AraC family transcriptional regulator [Merismopedia sp. SIO2A8]
MDNTCNIIGLIDRHAISEGVTETPIEGLQLFRQSHLVERLPGVYDPSLCVIVQGRKRAYLDGKTHIYDREQYLCCTLPIPAEAEVIEASPEKPLLGLLLSIETQAMFETVLEMAALDRGSASQAEVVPGLTVAKWDENFTTELQRLLELLNDPVALDILGSSRLRELMFAVLRGEAGGAFFHAFGAGMQQISRALTFLQANLHEAISIDELAKEAGMSRAVFHRKFKEVTTYSPIQFIKLHRLNEASRLIVSGSTVGDAAYRVGYSSQSQFSRDFRRYFGKSPRQWGLEQQSEL